jgi:hypothetical protein
MVLHMPFQLVVCPLQRLTAGVVFLRSVGYCVWYLCVYVQNAGTQYELYISVWLPQFT